jgi:C2 domain
MNSRQKPTSYTVSPLGYQCFLSINTLSVGSIDGVVWPKKRFQKKPPNLYVEVQVEGSVQRTRVVERSSTPVWNEEFSVCQSYGKLTANLILISTWLGQVWI